MYLFAIYAMVQVIGSDRRWNRILHKEGVMKGQRWSCLGWGKYVRHPRGGTYRDTPFKGLEHHLRDQLRDAIFGKATCRPRNPTSKARDATFERQHLG